MSKFLYPVSMKANAEQKQYLKGELKKLGYIIMGNPENAGCDYLCTNHAHLSDRATMLPDDCKMSNGRAFIPEYNPELFLALAAQKEGGGKGCWYRMANPSCVKGWELVKNEMEYLALGKECLATKEELIAHFTKSKTEDMKPSKEIQIERAKDSVEYHKKKLEKWQSTLAELQSTPKKVTIDDIVEELKPKWYWLIDGELSKAPKDKSHEYMAINEQEARNQALYAQLRLAVWWANMGEKKNTETHYIFMDNREWKLGVNVHTTRVDSPFIFHSKQARDKFLAIENIEELLKKYYETL